MSSDDASVEFMRGSIAANRDGAGKKLNITAGGAVVSMAEGALNLSRGRGEGLDVTLNKGSALVKTGEGEQRVTGDQRVVVAGDVRVFDIKIRLASPAPNEYFFTPAGNAAVAFSWEPALREGQAWLETAGPVVRGAHAHAGGRGKLRHVHSSRGNSLLEGTHQGPGERKDRAERSQKARRA